MTTRPTLPTHLTRPRSPDALTQSQRQTVCGSARYVKRERDPGEVEPQAINRMTMPIYAPPVWTAPVR